MYFSNNIVLEFIMSTNYQNFYILQHKMKEKSKFVLQSTRYNREVGFIVSVNYSNF